MGDAVQHHFYPYDRPRPCQPFRSPQKRERVAAGRPDQAKTPLVEPGHLRFTESPARREDDCVHEPGIEFGVPWLTDGARRRSVGEGCMHEEPSCEPR